MSQHYLSTTRNTGGAVEVLMGWDRPLKYHFLIVETVAQADGEDDTYLYDNLRDFTPDKDLGYYRAKLAELGIPVPETVFAEVQRDADMNVGNRRVKHFPDGTFTVLNPG